ncbi:MAG TPA: FecR domain-containing protein [Terriglobia bacterium]|nr:FecR domain-containing protein [Terriglobia bacterium]
MNRKDNSDYLWDGSGEPDPEIQRLESVLGKLRHQGARPVFPKTVAAVPWWPGFRLGWPMRLAALSGAAIVALVAVVAVWFVVHRKNQSRVPVLGGASSDWQVARLGGAPRVGDLAIEDQTGRLAPGQTLVTDSRSRAEITAEETGEIQVDPDTRLRVVESGAERKRLALDRGIIHAFIWAPPGEFMVDTPSATAVDMGCAYTLQVDDSGAGLLRTTLGWVGFRLDGHDAFIPAGAVCATRPGIGPGTPCFEDAPPAFRAALTQFDFGPVDQRASALNTILADARKRDALTLWHLLVRVDGKERTRVYDRLAQLVAPPPAVTRAGIMRLDPTMLDLWWNELGLGDVSLWRTFERSWPESGDRTNKNYR